MLSGPQPHLPTLTNPRASQTNPNIGLSQLPAHFQYLPYPHSQQPQTLSFNMRALILLALVIGVAYCAPQLMYYELEYKPVLASQALPAAAAAARPSEVEILLAAQQAAAGVPAPVPKDNDDDDHDD
ncbi:hypothetical protein cypCar_00011004 [Cyprinus carpio]|nr:hypothetical protein cypCar_00011004 [Cyprinus carpio]